MRAILGSAVIFGVLMGMVAATLSLCSFRGPFPPADREMIAFFDQRRPQIEALARALRGGGPLRLALTEQPPPELAETWRLLAAVGVREVEVTAEGGVVLAYAQGTDWRKDLVWRPTPPPEAEMARDLDVAYHDGGGAAWRWILGNWHLRLQGR